MGSGAQKVVGALDFDECAPILPPIGTTRVARVGGQLVVAADGGAFTPLFGGTSESALRARSASFMASGFAVSFDDLSAIAAYAPSNGAAMSTLYGPGVVACPAVAAALIAKSGVWVKNPRVTKWHLAGRMLMASTVSAADAKAIQLHDGTGSNLIGVGLYQATSATKFSFRVTQTGTPTTALSTVNYDNLYHVVEIWFDGVSVWGSVDNETPVLITSVAGNIPNVGLAERHGNEAAGGTGITYIDFAYAAAERTAS